MFHAIVYLDSLHNSINVSLKQTVIEQQGEQITIATKYQQTSQTKNTCLQNPSKLIKTTSCWAVGIVQSLCILAPTNTPLIGLNRGFYTIRWVACYGSCEVSKGWLPAAKHLPETSLPLADHSGSCLGGPASPAPPAAAGIRSKVSSKASGARREDEEEPMTSTLM